jgi:hypothetical protein
MSDIDGLSLIFEKLCAPIPSPVFRRELWNECYMPTFDLGRWPQVHATVAGFRIRATMLYPTDGERRAELHATLALTYYDTIRDDPNAWEREPTLTELYPLFHVRHLGGSQAEVFQRAREVACRGSVAGEALIIIRQMAEHGQDGSVNKACDILAKAGKAGRLTGGHMLIPYANSKALRAEAWVPYRSVAHLWAAHNLMCRFAGTRRRMASAQR